MQTPSNAGIRNPLSILKSRLNRIGPSAALSLATSLALSLALNALAPQSALAQAATASSPGSLTLYTARHYSSDEGLYKAFTDKTGIKINVVSAGDEPLLERLKSEGKASPADVLLLADASRLWKAESEGLFQPTVSPILRKAIPNSLRSGDQWFGFTTRARIVVIDPSRVDAKKIQSYDDLARPEFKGLVCTRSASHPYMLSLIGSQIEHLGAAKAQAWAQGLVNNLARPAKGGDTDQIKAVASGECGIALSNSYYYVRLMRSMAPADLEVVKKTQIVWPSGKGAGVHQNISGGGTLKNAPNPAAAKAFLEFLASPEAQAAFAGGNNEWPVVAGVRYDNPELAKLAGYRADPLPVAKFAARQREAAMLADRLGWK